MHSILISRNRHLLRDVERLAQDILGVEVPEALKSYQTHISSVCELLKGQIQNNLRDLSLSQDSILEDVLSNTQQATQYLRLLSSRMVTPILRSCPSDQLSLKFVGWLHRQQPATAQYPAVVTDGECSVWPFLHICPIYFFPAAEQRVLLYLPLYFHEFGHLLYACHKEELDAIVRDLQQDVEDILTPASYRGDKHSSWQRAQREAVVTTWYKWTQELYCDAVGLTIGGPAFLWAFSTYLGTLDRGDFYRTPSELRWSSHPVTWLRVRMLSGQAAKLGLTSVAKAVLSEWETIATTMGVVEDYHGYYDDALEVHIRRALADMLTETAPRRFCQDDVGNGSDMVSPDDSPVSLVHRSWRVFSSKSVEEYTAWERNAIASWLS